MKFDLSWDAIEARRDKIHRRLPSLALRTKRQTLAFIERVGFCFLYGAENSNLPSVLNAACGSRRAKISKRSEHDPRLSLMAELRRVLPSGREVFYGKVIQGRPSIVSLDLLPCFLALAHRLGTKEEYLSEFANGRLTYLAKLIMEALVESSPQETRGLRLDVVGSSRSLAASFEKAMHELQTKMLIVNIADDYDPAAFQWAPLHKWFPKEIRKARRTSVDEARQEILGKYFDVQYVSTVRDIQRALGWKRQAIFQTLGRLTEQGKVTPRVKVDNSDGKFYACTG